MTAQTDYFCVQFSELGNSIAYKMYNNVGRENRKYIFLFLHIIKKRKSSIFLKSCAGIPTTLNVIDTKKCSSSSRFGNIGFNLLYAYFDIIK